MPIVFSILTLKNNPEFVLNKLTTILSQKPLLFLLLLYFVRLFVSSFFIHHSYYADEFNDYFTTAHGLVFSHTLGEWYMRTNMRSYVIVQPLVFILQFFKTIGIKSLFLQYEGIKLAIGFFSAFGLYFSYQFAILRWNDRRKAFAIGLVFVFHPLLIFYNQSLLTEQLSATVFLFHFFGYAYLEKHASILSRFKVFAIFFLLLCSAGLSVMARLDAALFLFPFYLWLLISFKRKLFWMLFPLSFLFAFLLLGFLELIYSGSFFGPELNRVLFEGIERRGYIGAISPPLFTFESMAGNTLHIFFFIFLYYFIRGLKKPDIYYLPLICYTAFHLWMPHKEFRYLYPIAFILILFLFERLPERYAVVKPSWSFMGFWGLILLNVIIVMFFIPWSGQPRLTQQIAEANYRWENKPVFIAEPPKVLPHDELDPFIDFVSFSTIVNSSQLPGGGYILFVEAKRRKDWKSVTDKCEEILPLSKMARENLRESNYYHYYCQ
ncbi:hypothetical protein KJ966_09040 [bacterium]|nr:hypothetical protein [bacterium]